MPVVPNELFTIQSMLTLSGATGATFIICNGLQTAFNFNPRWLGLAVAQVIMLSGVAASGGTGTIAYLIGVINGFLVYSSAAGATSAFGGAGPATIARGQVPIPNTSAPLARRGFLSPWF